MKRHRALTSNSTTFALGVMLYSWLPVAAAGNIATRRFPAKEQLWKRKGHTNQFAAFEADVRQLMNEPPVSASAINFVKDLPVRLPEPDFPSRHQNS